MRFAPGDESAGETGAPGGDAAVSAAGMTGKIRKDEGKMKVAVTYENGQVFQHFGHTEQFKVYEIEDGKISSSDIVDTNGSGHGALAQFLKERNIGALICGGIGGGARTALAGAGIELYPGVSGNADEQAAAFAAGTLRYNPDTLCSHHHEGHGGDCGHSGGSCHHGNC